MPYLFRLCCSPRRPAKSRTRTFRLTRLRRSLLKRRRTRYYPAFRVNQNRNRTGGDKVHDEYNDEKELYVSNQLSNYVGGQWSNGAAGDFADVSNPANGERLAEVPLERGEDVTAVIKAAEAAFPAWRRTPPEERTQYLFKLKQILENNIEEIARLVTQESGKTLVEARAEIRRGIENVEVACGLRRFSDPS